MRLLFKLFLNSFLSVFSLPQDAFDHRPLEELLAEQGLDEFLQRRLVHGVLLQPSMYGLTAADALRLLRLFVESVGRYGPDAGPFLTPMYGCGELPQAFCRAAAVSGAVQVLRCDVAGLVFDEHSFSCTGVELGSGQSLRCGSLAGGPGALAEWVATFGPEVETGLVHRCVVVLDAPVVPGAQQALVVVPGTGPGARAVWALQLGHSTAVSPPGRWLLHLWTAETGSSDAKEALLLALESLADCAGLEEGAVEVPADATPTTSPSGEEDTSPKALLAAFFSLKTVKMTSGVETPGAWPRNVVLCPGPSGAVALAGAVADAKACYWALFPEEEPAADAQFPLDPAPRPDSDGEAASDDEAVQALQSALGGGSAAGEDSAQENHAEEGIYI